ncbi:MAG: GNAT family N-acetyltransferase [Gaiellales bacterium]
MGAQPATVLETERLTFRLLRMDDLDRLYALYRDPEVRRYFPEGTLTHEQTRDELEWIIDVSYRRYGFGLWATTDRETGELIGRCGLIPWTIDGRDEVEVAYLLARDRWGRGLATEAASAILRYGFEQLRLTRLVCLVDPEHLTSRRVAEKIGMTLERVGEIEGALTALYST